MAQLTPSQIKVQGAQMNLKVDQKPVDKGALVLGTIMSIPLFFVCFGICAIAVYMVYTFFMSVQGAGITRLVEVAATGISSVVGVWVGRWVCDKAFKAWSGWPIFILLLLLTALTLFAISTGYSDGWWQSALQMIQLLVATGASWFWLVQKLPID